MYVNEHTGAAVRGAVCVSWQDVVGETLCAGRVVRCLAAGLELRFLFGSHSALLAESERKTRALCEDESCGLARATSDDGVVRGLGASGNRRELGEPALPGIPSTCSKQNDSSGNGRDSEGSGGARAPFTDGGKGLKLRVLRYAADGNRRRLPIRAGVHTRASRLAWSADCRRRWRRRSSRRQAVVDLLEDALEDVRQIACLRHMEVVP